MPGPSRRTGGDRPNCARKLLTCQGLSEEAFFYVLLGMSRRIRFIPDEGPLVEVTCRALHSRLLFRPNPGRPIAGPAGRWVVHQLSKSQIALSDARPSLSDTDQREKTLGGDGKPSLR
jgi:hypothetical protein